MAASAVADGPVPDSPVPDSRVSAAVSHWAPRFIANGIDYNDFVRVTSAIQSWDAWCQQWCAAGAEHEKLGFHQGWAMCAEQLAALVE